MKPAAYFSRANDGAVDAQQALVTRILASHYFEKSARLRDFLGYVCDHALHTPVTALCEREIGCAVFGRPPDYDYRSRQHRPRKCIAGPQRLEADFAREGQTEPLLLELPKGKYAPVFRPRLVISGTDPEGNQPAVSPPVRANLRRASK